MNVKNCIPLSWQEDHSSDDYGAVDRDIRSSSRYAAQRRKKKKKEKRKLCYRYYYLQPGYFRLTASTKRPTLSQNSSLK